MENFPVRISHQLHSGQLDLRFGVCQREYSIGQPSPEPFVVAELFEEFRVILEYGSHHAK